LVSVRELARQARAKAKGPDEDPELAALLPAVDVDG
jgi:hypothetical protein